MNLFITDKNECFITHEQLLFLFQMNDMEEINNRELVYCCRLSPMDL